MPDRVTNTIFCADGTTVYRPTVINCYDAELPGVEAWWELWKTFVFDTDVAVATKTGGAAVQSKRVFQLCDPISRSKYPAVTENEEAISIPLQLACMAAFDAILVHVVNLLAPGKWQGRGAIQKRFLSSMWRGKFDVSFDASAR